MSRNFVYNKSEILKINAYILYKNSLFYLNTKNFKYYVHFKHLMSCEFR